LTTIKTYLPEYKEALLDIFKSNMPLYFADEELPLFSSFLDRDATERGPYSIVFEREEIIGCGGIALNQPTKYTNEQHVIMTWGMVNNKHHKSGYGKVLLLHRIEQAKAIYPGIKIALGTTQHTYQFFEKYGFKTVAYEKDHWGKDLDLYQMELI
jgi:N-acetylglutamate synthase-like GNAT family acetyltransferase